MMMTSLVQFKYHMRDVFLQVKTLKAGAFPQSTGNISLFSGDLDYLKKRSFKQEQNQNREQAH